MHKAKIVIIEDNPAILRTNRGLLEAEGYLVLTAETLTEGREITARENPDLILLDIMLPDGSGLAYSKELFGQDAPRILFLSALGTKEDVIAGLRAGGDDYMTKPYLMEELLLRVQALLRRGKKATPGFFQAGALVLNQTAGRAYLHGIDLCLKPKEYAILEMLMNNRDRYLLAEQIYESLWAMPSADDIRTVWEHISRIRKKLGEGAPVDIESARGKGYRLIDNLGNDVPRL